MSSSTPAKEPGRHLPELQVRIPEGQSAASAATPTPLFGKDHAVVSPVSAPDTCKSEVEATEDEKYQAFLQDFEKREKEKEEAERQEISRLLEHKEKDKEYKQALSTLDEVIAKATDYDKKMVELMGMYDDRALGITGQPEAMVGGTLRDYQLSGFQWLVKKYHYGESAILADEMGLGKTVQVISFMTWLWEKSRRALPPILIIGPLSTVGNWVAEFQRFTPGLPVLRYHGNREEREAMRQEHFPPEAFSGAPVRGLPIVITSYDIAVKDMELLGNVCWRALVVDEGHRLKNESSVLRSILKSYDKFSSTRSASVLRAPQSGERGKGPGSHGKGKAAAAASGKGKKGAGGSASAASSPAAGGAGAGGAAASSPTSAPAAIAMPLFKLLLTGTPVQNDLIELWSLCNFVMPNIFHRREDFVSIYRFIGAHTQEGKDFIRRQDMENRIIRKLRSLIGRYMLHRTKQDVRLSLPPKVEAIIYTPLSQVQLRMLQALDKGRLPQELRAMGWVTEKERFLAAPDTSSSSSGGGGDGEGHGGAALSTNNPQMLFREILAHPFTVAEPADCMFSTDERIVASCGKLAVLDMMLQRLRAAGHKVLIFSQFTKVLDLLADYFDYRGEALLGQYRYLSGQVKALDRDKDIAAFNKDPDNKIFAFLLSTRAGGLGINLAAADTVIFYDSDWNPKSDAQAQDRAHRIGQKRPVVVYRLVTAGASVERTMLKVADAKGSLSRIVLQEGKQQLLSDYQSALQKELASKGEGRKQKLKGGAARTGGEGGGEEGQQQQQQQQQEEEDRESALNAMLLNFWLRRDYGAAAGAAATGAAAAAGGAGSEEGSGEMASKKREGVLAHTSTQELQEAFAASSITEEELSAILDRPRAVQAGIHAAKATERQLLLHAGLPADGKESKKAEHHSAHSAGELHASPASGRKRGRAADAAEEGSDKEGSAASTPAKTPLFSHSRRSRRGLDGSALQSEQAAPASAGKKSPGRKGRRGSSVGSSEDEKKHASSLHTGTSSRLPIPAEDADFAAWQAWADAAPSTAVLGRGYEFVYHVASRGAAAAAAALKGGAGDEEEIEGEGGAQKGVSASSSSSSHSHSHSQHAEMSRLVGLEAIAPAPAEEEELLQQHHRRRLRKATAAAAGGAAGGAGSSVHSSHHGLRSEGAEVQVEE